MRIVATIRDQAKLGGSWLSDCASVAGHLRELLCVSHPSINRSSCESVQVLLLFHALLRLSAEMNLLSSRRTFPAGFFVGHALFAGKK